MDVIKEVARLEALKRKAHADGKVGMVLWYQAMIDDLQASSVEGRISVLRETRIDPLS